jgi:hypothetical protein
MIGNQSFTFYKKEDADRLRAITAAISKLELDNEWKRFIVSDDLSELRRWQPGTELPRYDYVSHLQPPHIRALQRLIHAFCLPILDRTRKSWLATDYPTRIPDEIAKALERELRR